MHAIIRRSTHVALAAALLLCSLAAPDGASAQDAPDIRGTYAVSGTWSYTGCDEIGENLTFPISIFLVVADQTGTRFSAELSFPDQQLVFFRLTGNVAADGSLAGTWQYVGEETEDPFFDRQFTGKIADGKAEVVLTGKIGVPESVVCDVEIALSTETGILQWLPPDAAAPAELPPPRALTFTPAAGDAATFARSDAPLPGRRAAAPKRDGEVVGYNVYRSNTPGVDTTPENLFASVPATTTSVPGPVGSGGSFFVVTAVYEEGESDPSNEVSGGVEAATLGKVKVKAAKIRASGTGFSDVVQVLVDGIPFASPAKVKKNRTVVLQTGTLLTGQTLGEYITSGKTVSITFRNANGGTATYVYTRP